MSLAEGHLLHRHHAIDHGLEQPKSHQVAAAPPYSTAVRLGKPGSGTRIVIDLDGAPKRSRQDGDALVLSF